MSQRPTIKDIARMTGLSVSAVSKALHDAPDISVATKERVRQVCGQVGYVPNLNARNLVRGSNRTIGLLLPDIAALPYAALYKGAAGALEGAAFSLYLADSNNSAEAEQQHLMRMLEHQVTGLLVMPVAQVTPEMLEAAGRLTCVFINAPSSSAGCHALAADYYRAGYMAVSHLLLQGKRRLVLAGGNLRGAAHAQLLRGWQAAAAEAGARPLLMDADESTGSSYEAGYALGQKITHTCRPPVAVAAPNDEVAAGVLAGLLAGGWQVPKDAILIGAGNYPFSHLPPLSLSTIDTAPGQLGAAAAQWLLQLADKTEAAPPPLPAPRLIARGTTQIRRGMEMPPAAR